MTGTLIKKGTKGPPPLPSSPGSQLFVVGGGASELVVLVVVSGEHGGNSGQDRGGSPTQIWGFVRSTIPASCIKLVIPPSLDSPCLPHQADPASPRLLDDPSTQWPLPRMSR